MKSSILKKLDKLRIFSENFCFYFYSNFDRNPYYFHHSVWDIGVAEFNCASRFGKFFIDFLHSFKPCSCPHIPAMNTVHNNQVMCYALIIGAC